MDFHPIEAFTRAFKSVYSITPSEYRNNPVPVILRTKINPFDRYFLGIGEIGMVKSTGDIKIYFVTSLLISFCILGTMKRWILGFLEKAGDYSRSGLRYYLRFAR